MGTGKGKIGFPNNEPGGRWKSLDSREEEEQVARHWVPSIRGLKVAVRAEGTKRRPSVTHIITHLFRFYVYELFFFFFI